MDKDYFMNSGIPPPQPLHYETSMPIPWSNDQPFNPNSSMDQFSNFDSAWTSMVSSTSTSTAAAALSNETYALRQLIGKLGGAGPSAVATPFAGNANAHHSPKLSFDQINLAPPPLASLSADPGFAERAAKFSCFGSRSFNGRTLPPSNASEMMRGSNPPPAAEAKLTRVASSPLLKQSGSPPRNKNPGVEMRGPEKKLSKLSGSGANSNEESSVSEQIPSGETGSKVSNEMNSRKRKAISRGKNKDDRSNSAKASEGEEDGKTKRSKQRENEGEEDGKTKRSKQRENEAEEEENDKNEKAPEPLKDYIHVRARRGQATDSHSLAERVRREKISERMKLLQDLVPGCNKLTGKALMLDEIINYVQSLQRQVEFLSMKLASVNPGMDFNMENLLSKDMFQQSTALPQQMYPLDSSFYHHQNNNVQHQQLHGTNISSAQCSVDPHPLDANLGLQMPSVDGFSENLPQFPAFTEDDLHSIVQMGFIQNSVNFPAQNQSSNMKVEL